MNGRLYDPVVGRFLNADPVIQDAGNTQNFNRYSYCLNNPLKYSDPSGYIHSHYWLKSHDEFSSVINGDSNGGGGGGFGLPGRGGNGSGLNGTYYDWYSGTYRSTASGNPEVGWGYAFNNAVLPNGPVYRYGVVGGDGVGDGPWSTEYGNIVYRYGWYDASAWSNNSIASPPVINAQGQEGYSGDGPLFTVADWTNNGIGGLATGMERSGGTFRLSNSKGFYPKYYASGWRGNGSVTTYNSATWGNRIAKGSFVVNFGLGAYSINKANLADGRTFGYNTQVATGQFVGGMAGSWAGALVGAEIGVWFGGVGAIPGAVIGGVVGGVFGGWGGSELGGAAVKWAY